MTDKEKVEARAVAVLYRDFWQSMADATEALMPIDELAYRIHPERQTYARHVIRELARDDEVPVVECMDGKCVEFLIDDTDTLAKWVMIFVGERQENGELVVEP